jgi:hypothetical protein
MHEDEVVDGWHLAQFFAHALLDPTRLEGQETLDAQAVELALDQEFAAVGGTHGEPGKIIHILYMWMKRFLEVTQMAQEFLIRTQMTQITQIF